MTEEKYPASSHDDDKGQINELQTEHIHGEPDPAFMSLPKSESNNNLNSRENLNSCSTTMMSLEPPKNPTPSKRTRLETNNTTTKTMKSSLKKDTSRIYGVVAVCPETTTQNIEEKQLKTMDIQLCTCSMPKGCVTLKNILKSFNAPISEEQAWAFIYQSVRLYRDACRNRNLQKDFGSADHHFKVPVDIENLNVHKDGSVHINCNIKDGDKCKVMSQKKILLQLGFVVYKALDYNLPEDEECIISPELEQLISHMTAEDNDDEGIERDSEEEDAKNQDTKELDYVLELCGPRVQPSKPEDHYKAVCRALATESLELRIFLQTVFVEGDAETLRIKADAQTSSKELANLRFQDWARFWMQVVDELRRGVRLKKCNFERPSVEFALTPYEILMEDIRTRKYNLRKVMVNGDIPPRVKKDAHAVILEFIRSRPPLKKASERELPPPIKRTPSPREQLMDSIRQGQVLKHIQPPRLKNRLLPASSTTTTTTSTLATSSQQVESIKKEEIASSSQNSSPRTRQRLIKVDFSLLQDDDLWDSGEPSLQSNHSSQGSNIQMPPYPGTEGYNNENNPNNINTVVRRTTYDLATQCESRRASMRRHTIVGCQSNISETHSMPPSRPDSRQSDVSTCSTSTAGASTTVPSQAKRQKPPPYPNQQAQQQSTILHQQHQQQQQQQQQQSQQQKSSQHLGQSESNLTTCSSSNNPQPPVETWPPKNSLDENQWTDRISDRLSLTLEEIVHIRSVMTKAELEGLPVGVRVKEDVERRKVCFLCLRTRFSIFGPWGIQCKLCQRTVCSKCYSKMRIPTEHFRNVPVVLLSPSLMNSPVGSNAPSPSHHSHIVHHVTTSATATNSSVDESFPKTLMERLLRPESDRKTRNTVGSAPSSPKHQRSIIITPGSGGGAHNGDGDVGARRQSGSMAKSMGSTELSMPTVSNGSMIAQITSTNVGSNSQLSNNKENNGTTIVNGTPASTATNRNVTAVMSRSMEGPKSLPPQSPARPHSNSSTLDRKNRFARAFTLSSSAHLSEKENLRGELMAVCNDCRGLVLEIIRSSRQTRSSARNRALKNLTLDLSPVYKQ